MVQIPVLNQDSQDFKITKIEHNPGNPLILKIPVQTISVISGSHSGLVSQSPDFP